MERIEAPRRRTTVPPPDPEGCPLTAAIDAIGGKWNLICLYWLAVQPRRFNELRRLMPAISHKVLAATLQRLEREGLVCRTVHPHVPPQVEYRISPHGETLDSLIQSVRAWGRHHLEWKGRRAQARRRRMVDAAAAPVPPRRSRSGAQRLGKPPRG
jgi:DNA-binding HxlR family transcriptional regulator